MESNTIEYEKSDKFWIAIDALVSEYINRTSPNCLCFIDVDRWRTNLIDDMIEIIQTWQMGIPHISERRRMVNELPLFFMRLGGYAKYEEDQIVNFIRLSIEKIYSVYVVPGTVFTGDVI